MAFEDPNANTDVGGALTGQVDPEEAGARWDDYLTRPGNRQALMQIGLQLMQPVGIGQTVSGHIGQAIGAGGEAVDRIEAADLKDRVAESKLQFADEKLRIAQQQADAGTLRATSQAAARASKKVGGLTDLVRARFAREDERGYQKTIATEVKRIQDKLDPVNKMLDPTDAEIMEFKDKTPQQIREAVIARTPKPKYGSIPSNVDDTEVDDEGQPVDQKPLTPATYPGAKLAADGKYYVIQNGKKYRVEP